MLVTWETSHFERSWLNAVARQNAAREEAAREAYFRKQKAEELERDRQRLIREEEYKRKKEKEEAERIRKEKERILLEKLQRNQNHYFNEIQDHNMPLQISQNEAFFFMVNIKENGTRLGEKYYREIQFIPFSLKTNNKKQLPYKNKVVADFIKKTKITKMDIAN